MQSKKNRWRERKRDRALGALGVPHHDLSQADLSCLEDAVNSAEPLTWVLTGDSITHGVVHTQGGRSYPQHLHELIRSELARPRDILINSAISGHRMTDILGDWERRISSWNPDVVTLMIGTNDVSTSPDRPHLKPTKFAALLREFVARVRAIGAIPVLQTPPAVDIAHAPERARIEEFVEAVRGVAQTEGVILVDQYARFAELGDGSIPWGLMGDPFHPNAAGHAALALELARVLGICPAPSRVLPLLETLVAAARPNP